MLGGGGGGKFIPDYSLKESNFESVAVAKIQIVFTVYHDDQASFSFLTMASSKNKPAFLPMPALASYVAGLGRGCVFSKFQCYYSFRCSASGFTTRSDIGPAREGPSAEVIA
jgi:hypothetical protein